MNTTSKRFDISKWIMLSLAILFNGFIIVYSCLSDKVTNEWSRYVSNIFTNIINSVTHKETKVVPITALYPEIDTEYTYNKLPGYEIDEIPLGYCKEINAIFRPFDATNKAINFTTEQNDIVRIESKLDSAFIYGLRTGEATIAVSNSDKTVSKDVKVKVVDNIGPIEFYTEIKNKQIAIGHPETINLSYRDTDKDPDKPYRYSLAYDFIKLHFDSSDESVATVDKYGVIHPVSEGTTLISIYCDGGLSRHNHDITVVAGTSPVPYSNLILEGSDVCYENDYAKDKGKGNKNCYQLTIKNDSATLDPKDFIWESSNSQKVKVNNNGVMWGYMKLSNTDEEVTITATSKKTGQSVSKVVTLKKQLPESITTCFTMGEREMWSPTRLTAFVGDVVTAKVYYEVSADNLNIIVNSSDNEMVDIVNQGSSVTLEFKKEGTVDITITSELVPTLSKTTTFTITKPGAINKDDYEDFNLSVRKSIGHALMFGVTQVFTFLAIYMFFYEKKWYWLALISLGCGVALASISELIQFFIPLRSGTFVDVLIDLAGVAVGLVLVVGIILLIKKIKQNKENKQKLQ